MMKLNYFMIISVSVTLLLSSADCLSSSVYPNAPALPPQPQRPEKWNHILSLMYGVGYCAVQRCSGAKLKVSKFTIHGLWPNSKDSDSSLLPPNPTPTHLLNCDPSSHLVKEDIITISGQMNLFWPDIEIPGDEMSFWGHEWKEHGTCFLDPLVKNAKLRYFTTTLGLFRKLDVNSLFKKFPPDNSAEYLVSDLHIQFKGREPYVLCGRSRGSGVVNILKELQFCVDAAGTTFVGCDKFYKFKTNCLGSKFKILKP